MELIVDDRERSVITYLEKLTNIKIERITVGDYAFVYNGKVIVTVERKSLADLAASIKDGRMRNNEKLLEARTKHNCMILYIIEGRAYPKPDSKIGRMPYACLQGMLDSLMFRHDIKIIWTKDCEHTANRLSGLCSKFTTMAMDGVFGDFTDKTPCMDDVIKPKHEIDMFRVHATMLTKISGISYKTAVIVLKKYTLIELLSGKTEEDTCRNLLYEGGARFGTRGEKIHNSCSNLHKSPVVQCKILSCINGINMGTAELILKDIKFSDIVCLSFKEGDIARMQKSEKRKIGKAIEIRVRNTFV